MGNQSIIAALLKSKTVGATRPHSMEIFRKGRPFLIRLAPGETLSGRPYDEIN